MDDIAPSKSMSAPSFRELELETVLKERDGHIRRLVDDIRALRRHIPQSAERTSDPNETVELPPAAASLLLSLSGRSKMTTAGTAGNGSSATVTAALSARLAALQKENDELYELLKKGTVTQLHDEVKQLRVTTKRMGSALSESNSVVGQLKTELDYAHKALRGQNGGPPVEAPRAFNHPLPQGPVAARDGSSGKAIPSGPRVQKRQRLDQPKQYDLSVPRSHLRRSNSREATPASSRWGDDRGGRDVDIISHEDVSQNEQTHTEYDQTLSRHSQTPPPRRYSPEDDHRGRSRTRSPPAYEHASKHLARDEPVRTGSALDSPRDFSYSPDPPSQRRSPGRSPDRHGGSTNGSHYIQDQDRRPRSPSRDRSPSPPRRSRSPSRVKHRENDSRRDRRRDERNYHSGTDRPRHGGYHNEARRRSPVPDVRVEREKERERDRSGPGSTGGSNSGARPRRRGPRNGTGNGIPNDLGRRYGQQGSSSNAGTLASRIQ